MITRHAVITTNPDMTDAATAASPTETIRYDVRGNVLETKDAGGGRRLFYYDHLDRKVAEVNALGTLSVWTYDGANNAIAARVYSTAVSLPAVSADPTAGTVRNPPSPATSDTFRETLYAYDRNNRLVETRVVGVRTGQYSAGAYTTGVGDLVTTNVYDASGNIVRQTDAGGASTFTFYDRLGRQVARVDQENYLTSYTLDAEGNFTKEERFASRLTGSAVTTASDPAALRTGVVKDTTLDRTTEFTYDLNGRRTAEKRLNVVYGNVDAGGNFAPAAPGRERRSSATSMTGWATSPARPKPPGTSPTSPTTSWAGRRPRPLRGSGTPAPRRRSGSRTRSIRPMTA